jgi:AcrR family transcriptional regulator
VTVSQRARSEKSTRALLDAAGEVIADVGYENMTLAAVGERAGYSRGLVTARFGSKENLLRALVERMTAGWTHRNVLPRTTGRPGLDGVVTLLDAIRAQAQADPRALRVLYALMFEALGPNADLRAHFVEFHRTMRSDIAKLVRRGVRDGSIRAGVDPLAEAVLIVGGLRGVAYQWALDADAFDPVGALAYLTKVTEDRLRRRRESLPSADQPSDERSRR